MKLAKRCTVALLALALSAPAFAAKVFLRPGDSEKLEHCGGTASFAEKKGQYILSLDTVKECSNLDLGAREQREIYESYKIPLKDKDGAVNGPRSGSYTMPSKLIADDARNTLQLRLRSNKASKLFDKTEDGTWDDITLEFGSERRTDIKLGEEAKLNNCGGTVSIAKSEQGDKGGEQLNIVVKGVRNCSDFVWEDLYNYKKLEKTEKKYTLQQNKQGDWNGSYTLSWDFIKNGKNQLNFLVTSNSGKTVDRFKVSFIAIK